MCMVPTRELTQAHQLYTHSLICACGQWCHMQLRVDTATIRIQNCSVTTALHCGFVSVFCFLLFFFLGTSTTFPLSILKPFSVSVILVFQEYNINRIIYVALRNQLTDIQRGQSECCFCALGESIPVLPPEKVGGSIFSFLFQRSLEVWSQRITGA